MRTVETYEQAVEYLLGRINYEQVHSDRYNARDLKLDRMAHLLRLLDNPQKQMAVVHIAGTKGKGSTATMIARILQQAGYRVGLFTSPHIEAFEERIRVNGRLLGQEELIELVNDVGPVVAEMDRTPGRWRPTFFELTTALAWLFFRRRQVQIAVVEVGLGGRLDSTNVCDPEVTLITSISRDHTHILGDTLEAIAREKAGIAKKGVPMIVGPLPEEAAEAVRDECKQRKAPLWEFGSHVLLLPTAQKENSTQAPRPQTDNVSTICVKTPVRNWSEVPVPLRGPHQQFNTAMALAAVDVLTSRGWQVSSKVAIEALQQVECPLRIEVVSENPTVILDAAHNWASISALVETIRQRTFGNRKRVLIYASAKDKDVAGHLRLLLPHFHSVILTQYSGNPRALPVSELVRIAGSVSNRPFHWTAQPSQAWKLARRFISDRDLICVTGSFFIAAEIRPLALEDFCPSSLQQANDDFFAASKTEKTN